MSKIAWFEQIFDAARSQGKVLDLDLLLSKFVLENASTKKTGLEILYMFDKLDKIMLGSDGVVVRK